MATSKLLPLPDEVLLNLAARLVNDPKHPCSKRDVLNFSLVCHRLIPIAQEVLFQAIVFDSAKVKSILGLLFRYPGLASKVKSVEIKSTSTPSEDPESIFNAHATRTPPKFPKIEGQFLQNCVRTVHGSPFNANTKQEWIANLKEADSLTHEPFICLLLYMVSNLEELYLGACKLYDVPFLWDMLTIFVADAVIQKDISSMNCILPALGSKLKVLELPNDVWPAVTHSRPRRGVLCSFAILFPCLQTLIIPEQRLRHPYTSEEDSYYLSLPASLERLIVVDSLEGVSGPKLRSLARNKDSHYPLLKEIKVFVVSSFRGSCLWGGDTYETKCQVAAEAKITYTEVFRKNAEYPIGMLSRHANNHIWRYTEEEIRQFEYPASMVHVEHQKRGFRPDRRIAAIKEAADRERAAREE